MDILYICDEKMRRSYMLEAISNKICTINNKSTHVENILVYLKKLKNLKIVYSYYWIR